MCLPPGANLSLVWIMFGVSKYLYMFWHLMLFSLDGQIDAQSDSFSVVKSTIHTDLHIVHPYRECHTKARVIYNVLVTKYDFHSIVKIPGKQCKRTLFEYFRPIFPNTTSKDVIFTIFNVLRITLNTTATPYLK